MIRALCFDLGRVVVELRYEQVIADVVARSNATPATLDAFLTGAPSTLALEEGRMSPREYFTEFQRAFAFRGDYPMFVRLWNQWVVEEPRMTALVAALGEQYPLGFVSNTNVLHLQYLLSENAFIRHFDRCIASCWVGVCKPQPRIFEIAIERMGHPPAEIFYTDDRPDCVEAARRCGLQAFPFTTYEACVETLGSLGVAWTTPSPQTVPAP